MTFGYDENQLAQRATKPVTNTTEYHYETVDDVLEYPCVEVPQQTISEEDAEHYGVRSAVSTQDGETVEATYFPYFNQKGDLTGFKKRDWTLDKDDKGHFTVVGTVKASSMLFGQHVCTTGGKRLFYVEGEGDVIATRRAILEGLEGTKWAGRIEPNVVGLNTGAAAAAEATAHNEKFIRSFVELVLGFDNDRATAGEAKKGIKKGEEALEDVASFLLADNIYTFTWPMGIKDPRDMLEEGRGAEFGKLISFSAEKYSPEKIVSGDDVTLDELIQPLREGLYLDRYPELMKKIHGLRTGNELITYAAFSGVGKSTLAREFAYGVVSEGLNTGFIFLEEPRIKTQQALVCLELGVMLPEFRENPLALVTREQIAEAKAKVLSNGHTYFLDHFGSLQVEKLMQQIRYLHFICGCEHIFLDHVSMVVAGLESNNERKDLDMLYEELAAFMTANPVTIHAVCHLKRVDDHKANKVDEDDPQPYWREVRKEMLRGSAGIEQMSSTIIVLENQIMPDGSRGLIRTRVEKNREWSSLGVCDTMTMLSDGRLHCVNELTGEVSDGSPAEPNTNAYKPQKKSKSDNPLL